MDNLILCLFVCLVIPIGMSGLVLENKSRSLVLFMVFGMFMCLFAGQVNGLLQELTGIGTYELTTSVTPVVEEILKGIPILAFYFLVKPNRQYMLECAIMVGIGFSLIENGYILLSNAESITFAMALFRGLGSAMLHVVTTMSLGFGISLFGIRKKTLFTGTYAILLATMVFHGIYNMLVQSSELLYFGIAMPTVIFAAFVIYGERRKRMEREE